METRKKLNLKKAILVSLTSGAVIFSGCATTAAAKEPAKKVESTTTVSDDKSPETIRKTNEKIFDDLLTATDGYDTPQDYDYFFAKEVKEEKNTEVETEVETEKETEVKVETKKEEKETKKETENDNPYLQYDAEGDAFVALDENGNFIENPEAPEKYAEESQTEVTTEAAKVASADQSGEKSEEAISYIKEMFANLDTTMVDGINNGDFENTANSIKEAVIESIDFLFFEGKIDKYTKNQVDRDTIVFIINQLNNYMSIANDLSAGCMETLPAKYLEAKLYISEEYIDKFDELGAEIIKNLPEEQTLEETTLSK